jgi:hypothetical protein
MRSLCRACQIRNNYHSLQFKFGMPLTHGHAFVILSRLGVEYILESFQQPWGCGSTAIKRYLFLTRRIYGDCGSHLITVLEMGF